MKSRFKFLVMMIFILFFVLSSVTGWTITTDSISSTSITWNVSQKPGAITALSYDGIQITDFDPNTNLLIQSGLYGNETHCINVISGGTVSNSSAITAENSNDLINDLFGRWSYVFIILLFFLAGTVLHWLFFFFGSGVSLYALAEWFVKNPNVVTDIWHIQFYIYIALFILGLLLWIFRKRK